MYSKRTIARYCVSAVLVVLGGCTTNTPESSADTTSSRATTETTASTSTTTADTTSTETTACRTRTTVRGGTDLFVANRASTEKRLSASVYRVTDGERLFSETYPLSGEERARSEDVITNSGRYRVEASTENGASASFETPLPDENDEPLDHYSIDVIVTESGNVEIGLSIADVGTPTAFGDGC